MSTRITNHTRLSRADAGGRLRTSNRGPWTSQRFDVEETKALSPDDIRRMKLDLLPATAEDFYCGAPRGAPYDDNDDGGQRQASVFGERRGWDDKLATVLAGTRAGTSSPLRLLRDHESTLIRRIYSYIYIHEHAKHVKLTIPAGLVGNLGGNTAVFGEGRTEPHCYKRRFCDTLLETSSGFNDGYVAFAKCGQIDFPEPSNRNVNMMPFILGDKESLPTDLRCYYDTVIEMCPYVKEEIGNVAYLTIHESNYVPPNTTQRRPGLHIESPGVYPDNEGDGSEGSHRTSCDGGGSNPDAGADAPDVSETSFAPGVEHSWGIGIFFGSDHYEGGIYFASNVSNSCQVFDALVDNKIPGIVDRYGGLSESLRPLLGNPTKLRAGELIWMTDCTPHEALPQADGGSRQFFRLVMPYISHWFANHSTPNPKVPVPDHVKIVSGNKFSQNG